MLDTASAEDCHLRSGADSMADCKETGHAELAAVRKSKTADGAQISDAAPIAINRAYSLSPQAMDAW